MTMLERSNRAGSSYKEEIYRLVHSQPNGVFEDDRVGVTLAIASALVSDIPITASTVSSALDTLRKEGRVITAYGHRSLGNKYLLTKVTACAEPHPGRAVGPSDPVERQSRQDTDEPIVNTLLRRVLTALHRESEPNTVDLDQFQAHVNHLIDEKERLALEVHEWQDIAKDIESSHERDTEALHLQIAEAQDALIATTRSVDVRIKKTEQDYARMRERAEQYRVERDEVRIRVDELARDLSSLSGEHIRQSAETELAIAGLRRRLSGQHEELVAARRERDESKATTKRIHHDISSIVRLSERREEYLIAEEIASIETLAGIILTVASTVETGGDGKPFVTGPLMERLGISRGRWIFNPDELDEVAGIIATSNGLRLDTGSKSIKLSRGNQEATRIKRSHLENLRRKLDEMIGPIQRVVS